MRRSMVIVALLAAPILARVSYAQERPTRPEQKSERDDARKCEKSKHSSTVSSMTRDQRADQRDEHEDNGRHRALDKKCGNPPPPPAPDPAPAPAPDPAPAPAPAPAPDPAPAPAPAPEPPPPAAYVGEIRGVVFVDMNTNNVFDAGEPTISDWSIQLTGPVSRTVMTDGTGAYAITALPPGTYTVCAAALDGFTLSTPSSGPSCPSGFGWSVTISDLTAAATATMNDINFGYRM
jgi:SdrD B-like domain